MFTKRKLSLSLILVLGLQFNLFSASRGDFWQLKEYLQSKPAAVYAVKAYAVNGNDSYKEYLDDIYKVLEGYYGGKFTPAKRVSAKEKNKAVEPFNDEPVYIQISLSGGISKSPTDGTESTYINLEISLMQNVFATGKIPYWESLVYISKKGRVNIAEILDEFKNSYSKAIDKVKKYLVDPKEMKILKVLDAKKRILEIDAKTGAGIDSKDIFFVVKEVDGDDPLTLWPEQKHYIGLAEFEIMNLGAESTKVKSSKPRKGVSIDDLVKFKVLHLQKYMKKRYSIK